MAVVNYLGQELLSDLTNMETTKLKLVYPHLLSSHRQQTTWVRNPFIIDPERKDYQILACLSIIKIVILFIMINGLTRMETCWTISDTKPRITLILHTYNLFASRGTPVLVILRNSTFWKGWLSHLATRYVVKFGMMSVHEHVSVASWEALIDGCHSYGVTSEVPLDGSPTTYQLLLQICHQGKVVCNPRLFWFHKMVSLHPKAVISLLPYQVDLGWRS